LALTDTAIRNAKPRDNAYKLSDGGGLFLLVQPTGGKLWRLKFRTLGKEKSLSFGSYPSVGLKDARKKRDSAKEQLAAGTDPAHEKMLGKIAARASAGNTFQAVAEEFVAAKMAANGRADVTVGKAKWILSLLYPILGSRPIADIKPAELHVALKKMEARGTPHTVVRARALASRVFRFGVATARCESDPAGLLMGAFSAPKAKNHAAILDPVKLGSFLRAVDSYSGGIVVKLAMQLLPHVYLRPGELRQGRWEEIDWDGHVWTVPADRTKLRRPHSAPLSTQSVALLRRLQEETGGFELMFPGTRRHTTPMSENTLNATYRRMGFSGEEVTSHGFRATASTLLNECGKWQVDAIERSLAHGHSDATRGAYARSQHFDERMKMAQWWSDYLDTLYRGGEVVLFAGEKRAKA